MSLCNVCSIISVVALWQDPFFPYHGSSRDLSDSCPLCGLIREKLQLYFQEHRLDSCIKISFGLRHIHHKATIRIGFYSDSGVWHSIEEGFQLFSADCSIEDTEKLLSQRGVYKQVHPSLGDPLIFLERELERCLATHTNCGKAMSGDSTNQPRLPSRVIDVSGPEGDIKLIEQPSDKSLRGQYNTLSHCWGPPERYSIQTTMANLQQHRKGIPFEKMSKTFKDAIQITRRLGVPYLWIDSLCIVQDDKSDWDREAPTMAAVYGKSHLTISATGAADGTEGCFIDTRTASKLVSIPIYKGGNANSGVFLRQVPFILRNINSGVCHLLGPLQHRAWITQEWALSPRLVHFCRGLLVWVCQEEQVSEDDTDLALSPLKITKFGWIPLVEEYTSRKLTRTTDRLAAMQGLISNFEEHFNETFAFGIPTSSFPMGLMWTRRLNEPKLERPKELQRLGIPSWSWASTIGSVVYKTDYPNKLDYTTPVCTFSLGPDFTELVIRSSRSYPLFKLRSSMEFLSGDLVLDEEDEAITKDLGALQSELYAVPIFYDSYEMGFHCLVVSPMLDTSNFFERVGVVWHYRPLPPRDNMFRFLEKEEYMETRTVVETRVI